ncbi:MAG: helix-turn-helix domain-containing protein [Lachnospiraceae bacterium]|nr:helix-turn-helix domain-containing protein [Lachnospiraceae bacterium]
MISNQILQNTIDGMTSIAHVELMVTDTDGRCVVTTMKNKANHEAAVVEFVNSAADSQEIQKCQFFKIFDEQQLEYILIADGAGENAHMVGKMVAFQIQNLLVAYKERYDKDNFVKNLLLDNLLLVDIYSRAKKLHLQIDLKRVVMIVETSSGKDANLLEMVKDYVGLAGSKEIVTAVDENNAIIVMELPDEQSIKDIEKNARGIVSHLTKEGLEGVRVAYGTIVDEIKEVSRSYKEAKMALDIGIIFFEEKDVIPYSELGIGRLIYQLPFPLCQMFINEIFGDKNPDDFDEETLSTINKFFENSLNVSETSRQLFIHRNTLVYRLDKLQKSTGLDLRVFEDAITFKIALMVVKYMKYMESTEF